MKILFGLIGLGVVLVGVYTLIAPASPEVLQNDPLPVPATPAELEPELPTTPPSPVTVTSPVTSDSAPVTAAPESSQNVSAPITGTPGHPTQGTVRTLTSDTNLIRFENYQGTNGPDLFVYLTNNLEDVSNGVNLGRSKSTTGNINYTVPDGVSISDYRYAVTWCERFGVLFDYAEINP